MGRRQNLRTMEGGKSREEDHVEERTMEINNIVARRRITVLGVLRQLLDPFLELLVAGLDLALFGIQSNVMVEWKSFFAVCTGMWVREFLLVRMRIDE